MNRLKSLLLIGILLIALPAAANHGIEALGDGLIDIAKYAIIAIIVIVVLALSIIFRFSRNQPLFSIGVYFSGAIILLFTLKNYFAAIEEYDNRYWIADSYPSSMTPGIIGNAESQVTSSAILFFLSLALVLAYLVIDILVARKHRKKQALVS